MRWAEETYTPEQQEWTGKQAETDTDTERNDREINKMAS